MQILKFYRVTATATTEFWVPAKSRAQAHEYALDTVRKDPKFLTWIIRRCKVQHRKLKVSPTHW